MNPLGLSLIGGNHHSGLQCPCLYVGNWARSLKRASLKTRIIFLLSPGLVLRQKQQTAGKKMYYTVLSGSGTRLSPRKGSGHKETPLMPMEAAIGRVSPRWWAMVFLSILLLVWLMIYLCCFPTGLAGCAMTVMLASGVWQGEDTFVFPVGSCWSYTSGVLPWSLTLELLSGDGNISDIIKLNRWSWSSCPLQPRIIPHITQLRVLPWVFPLPCDSWEERGYFMFLYSEVAQGPHATNPVQADSQWTLPTILILSKPSWRNDTHQLSWHRNMEMLVSGNDVKCSELIMNNHQDSHTRMLLCEFFP